MQPNYDKIKQICNQYRNYDDVAANWGSISGIINWFDHHQDTLIPVNGPGHWNDPDMVLPSLLFDRIRVGG